MHASAASQVLANARFSLYCAATPRRCVKVNLPGGFVDGRAIAQFPRRRARAGAAPGRRCPAGLSVTPPSSLPSPTHHLRHFTQSLFQPFPPTPGAAPARARRPASCSHGFSPVLPGPAIHLTLFRNSFPPTPHHASSSATAHWKGGGHPRGRLWAALS